jgi:hypothetical protein
MVSQHRAATVSFLRVGSQARHLLGIDRHIPSLIFWTDAGFPIPEKCLFPKMFAPNAAKPISGDIQLRL